MPSFLQSHALIVLADRVLHVAHGWPRGLRTLGRSGADGVGAVSAAALLAKALATLVSPRRFTLVLGAPWSRIDLVKLAGTVADADLPAVAEAHCARVWSSGGGPPDWRVRWQRRGEYLLLAAVESAQLDALMAVMAAHGRSAIAAEPLFTWLADHDRAGLARAGSWLAVGEPGCLTLAHRCAGGFDALRVLRTAGAPVALDEALDRLAAANGLAGGPVQVLTLGERPDAQPPRWRQHPVLVSELA